MSSLSCATHIESHFYEVIANSGRTIGRIGNYHNCIEAEGMDYYQVTVGT